MSDATGVDGTLPSRGQHPLYGQRVEIHVSRWRQSLRLLAAAAGTALAWFAYERGRADHDWRGYLTASLGVLTIWIGIRAIREILRFGPRMVISPEGFHDRSLGVTLPWDAFFAIQIDFPVLPRLLQIDILDEASWLPRLSGWKRTTYRARARSGGLLGLVVGLGGLRMPPDEIAWLIDAHLDRGSTDREMQDRAERRQERERWLALPWQRRQLEKWRASRGLFGVGTLAFFAIVFSLLAVWSVATLLLPYPEFDRLEGRLTSWGTMRHGRIVLEMETAEGPRRMMSHLEGYDAGRVLGGTRYGDPVVAFGRFDLFNFRFRGLSVNGRVVIDAERTRVIEEWGDRRILVLHLAILASIVGLVEYLWRWRLRHPYMRDIESDGEEGTKRLRHRSV